LRGTSRDDRQLGEEARKIPASRHPTLQATRPTPSPQGSIHREKITVEDVMGHALVQPFKHSASLGRPTSNPAYLPSSVFARALIDLLTPGDSMDPTLADIEVGIRELNDSPNLRWSLASILKSARGDGESFIGGLQAWFDRQMDRVTGSYKRWAKRWVIVIAIVIVGAGNIDSIAIARSLYAGGAVRTAVTQQASESFCYTPEDPTKCAQDATEFLEKTGIPWAGQIPTSRPAGWVCRSRALAC
jgi:hypothetical protein